MSAMIPTTIVENVEPPTPAKKPAASMLVDGIEIRNGQCNNVKTV